MMEELFARSLVDELPTDPFSTDAADRVLYHRYRGDFYLEA